MTNATCADILVRPKVLHRMTGRIKLKPLRLKFKENCSKWYLLEINNYVFALNSFVCIVL